MGRPPKHGNEVRDFIVREYREHVARGTLPEGWIKQKAAELGVHQQTVYLYIARAEQRPARPTIIQPRSHFDHSAAMRGGGSMHVVHASKWEGQN